MAKKQTGELFAINMRAESSRHTNVNSSEYFMCIVKEFKDIYVEELSDKLQLKRDLNFKINRKSNEPPPVVQVIGLFAGQLNRLNLQRTSLLRRGFIRPFTSDYGSPVSFVE